MFTLNTYTLKFDKFDLKGYVFDCVSVGVFTSACLTILLVCASYLITSTIPNGTYIVIMVTILLLLLIPGHIVWGTANSTLHGVGVSFPLAMDSFLSGYTTQIVKTAFYANHGEQYLSFLMKNLRVHEGWPPRQHFIKGSPNDLVEIRVMSYNILSHILLEKHRYLYKRQQPLELDWTHRMPKIVNEIVAESPDILCLQELESSETDALKKWIDQSYAYVFKKKTGEGTDGCAVFYRSTKFKLEDVSLVEFRQPSVPILNRDNVAVVLKLSLTSSPRDQFVVATTHLLYNPKRHDVRLAQTQLLLAELARMSESKYPIILTGDFNSRYDSEVIRLIEQGCVSHSFRKLTKLSRIAVRPDCRYGPPDPQERDSTSTSSESGLKNDKASLEWRGDRKGVESSSKSDTSQSFGSSPRENRRCRIDTGSILKDVFFVDDSVGNGQNKDEEAAGKTNHQSCDLSKWTKGCPESPNDRTSQRDNFSERVCHNLNLRSVYDHTDGYDTVATTHHDDWITVDYMFYSSCENLQLLSRTRLPTKEECSKLIKYLPNVVFPSDHLPLQGTFLLKKTKHK